MRDDGMVVEGHGCSHEGLLKIEEREFIVFIKGSGVQGLGFGVQGLGVPGVLGRGVGCRVWDVNCFGESGLG